eukprot:3024018-Prymnesium_polylepis.2
MHFLLTSSYDDSRRTGASVVSRADERLRSPGRFSGANRRMLSRSRPPGSCSRAPVWRAS